MAETFVTAEEVAARLKVPTKTIHTWRKKGTFPQGRKLGVRVIFLEREIDEWVEETFGEA
jgi:predicted DNA-binding transcriptional regulator AlpA